MIKITPFLLVAAFSGVLGYIINGVGNSLQLNYRWVQIFNKTDCEIRSASVLFPDRTVTVFSDQISSSVYPHGGEAAINIPVLASKLQQYRISLDFEDCPIRNSQPQEFASGSHIHVWVDNQDFRFGVR